MYDMKCYPSLSDWILAWIASLKKVVCKEHVTGYCSIKKIAYYQGQFQDEDTEIVI